MRPAVYFACFLLGCLSGIVSPLAHAQDSYLLGPRDRIEVRVFREADLSVTARIQADNSILVPVVGRVIIGGLTEQQAAARIESSLTDGGVVQDPAVTIQIIEFASKRVAVLGFVNSPGSYTLDRPSTISDLLAMAGGAQAESADELYFSDYNPDTGEIVRSEIVIRDLLASGSGELDRQVGQGDTIFVPRAPVYYIYGQVRAPGVYRLYRDMTVEQALATAGGVTDLGKASKIRIRPNGETGKMRSAELGASLANGDVLFVPERIF